MPKTLTDGELAELREIIEKVDYRLVTSNGQMLAEAAHGETLEPANSFQLDLGPELDLMKRARTILGMPHGADQGDGFGPTIAM